MPRIPINAVRIGLCVEANIASGPNQANCSGGVNGVTATAYSELCGGANTTWIGIDKIKTFKMPLSKRTMVFDELALSDNAFASQVYAQEEKSVDGQLTQYMQSTPNSTSATDPLGWMLHAQAVNGGDINNYCMYWRIGSTAYDQIVYNTFGTQPSEVKITWEEGKPTLIETTLMAVASRSSLDGGANAPVLATPEPQFTSNSTPFNVWKDLNITASGITLGSLITLSTLKAKKLVLDIKATFQTDEFDLSAGQVYYPIVQSYVGELTITYLEPTSLNSPIYKLQSTTVLTTYTGTIINANPTSTISLTGVWIKSSNDEGDYDRKLKEFETVFGFTGITLA